MDLIKKYEKLAVRYNALFAKAVEDTEDTKVEDCSTIDVIFNKKKWRACKTIFLRANYYRVVSSRIMEEWTEAVKQEKEKITNG